MKIDEIEKSRKFASTVIAAKAGIQVFQILMDVGSKPALDLIRGSGMTKSGLLRFHQI